MFSKNTTYKIKIKSCILNIFSKHELYLIKIKENRTEEINTKKIHVAYETK